MILIQNGQVLRPDGSFVQATDVLVKGTRIEAVGPALDGGESCRTIDATGCYVIPGLIDAHCHLGMWESMIGFEGSDGNEKSDPVTPQLRAIDAINPMDITFKEAREAGVTCVATGPGSANVIGGQFAAIKTCGHRIDDMVLKAPLAMKCAFGKNPKEAYNSQSKAPQTRMAIASVFREVMLKAQRYRDKLEAAGEDVSKRPDYDMKSEALLPVLRGELPIKAHAHRADDIFTVLRLAREFGLRLTLDHATEGHLIADVLAAEHVPCIVGPSFGHRGKYELKHKSFKTPAILSEAGVKVAITTDSPVTPLQYLPLMAGLAVKEGLSISEAMKAITIAPAEILGISDRVGSLEAGKDADAVVMKGHPLEVMSTVQHVLINGEDVVA
ncbi:MAG: amidohydrolase [Lentisphaerae bacterium]|nr:amidohydrolase [Lentisphaerota bacterium]MBT4816422.1 amidohydrolase [Lentisphaerota bacterium]MBT5604580.1 amidohydrolase [Lentisphaerota bacterium]MBT7061753.1 amidohydrolase [Lentisphaerota bacterium]MBT7848789.1 amidohydrolase [Lentisphaerota bacterium]